MYERTVAPYAVGLTHQIRNTQYAIRNCPHVAPTRALDTQYAIRNTQLLSQECCRTRSNTRYAIRNVQQPPHSPRQSTRYAMRNTQYAAGATAGVLNTQIKRKIRSLLIRSVNRIAQVSAADKEKLCCPRKLPTSSHDPLNRVTTRKAAGVLTASPPPSAPTSPCAKCHVLLDAPPRPAPTLLPQRPTLSPIPSPTTFRVPTIPHHSSPSPPIPTISHHSSGS